MFLNVTVLLQSLLLTSCPLMSHIPFLNLMAPAPRSPLFSSLLLSSPVKSPENKAVTGSAKHC